MVVLVGRFSPRQPTSKSLSFECDVGGEHKLLEVVFVPIDFAKPPNINSIPENCLSPSHAAQAILPERA
jgi:hypothetical protein